MYLCVCSVCDAFPLSIHVLCPLRSFPCLVVVNIVCYKHWGMHLFKLAGFFVCLFFVCRCIFRSGIAESYVVPVFIFEEPSILFSSVAASIYISTMIFRVPFRQPHQYFVIVNFLMIAILTVCDFDIHFDDYNWISLLKGVVTKATRPLTSPEACVCKSSGKTWKGHIFTLTYKPETRKSR